MIIRTQKYGRSMAAIQQCGWPVSRVYSGVRCRERNGWLENATGRDWAVTGDRQRQIVGWNSEE